MGHQLGVSPSIDTVSTMSPALNALLDRLQKRQEDLDDKLGAVTSSLASLDEECRLRSEMITNLRTRLDELDSRKADRSEVEKLDQQKADKNELKFKVAREDFDSALADMNSQINRIFNDMVELEGNWKTSLEQTKE